MPTETTLRRMAERVDKLGHNFNAYLHRFDKENVFTGPITNMAMNLLLAREYHF